MGYEEENRDFTLKYRPATLNEYIGNDKVKESALAFLKSANRPQVILLYGDSGCGKTTFARLLAKEYLCEDRDEETGACNECPTCKEMNDYIHSGSTDNLYNVKEVDVADQGGKRDIDAVLEDMEIPSVNGEWKVYIFDEVHKASDAAQTRMLKVCEEPPEGVLMLLCTTEPDELLPTLKNRCRYKLRVKKPTVNELGGLMAKVCKYEGVDYEAKGLTFLANRADRTIRESLMSLQQVVTECGNANYSSAVHVFEEISDTMLLNYYEKLFGKPQYDKSGVLITDENGSPVYKRDVYGYISLLFKIKSEMDLTQFVKSLIEFTKRGIYTINQIQIDGISDGELDMYMRLFGDFPRDKIALLINKLIDLNSGRGDLETKLLMLGYTGLDNDINASTSVATATASNLDSGLAALLTEVSDERKSGTKNRETVRKELEHKGIEEADKLNKPVSIDDLQALFGNTSVDFG